MYNKIKEEIKSALITKNKDKKDVLRSIVSKAQMISKETKCDMSDDIVLVAIQKELKQLNQTKDTIPESTELHKSTIYKISIIEEYLPKQMTEEEVRSAVSKILSSGEYDNMGVKMKVVMNELKGKADNKLISKIVKEF